MCDEEDSEQRVIDEKWRHARDVLREADFLCLGVNEEDGAPEDEYDYEALVMAASIPSDSSVERASQIVAYVFSISFATPVRAEECIGIARRLLDGWPQDRMREGDDFRPEVVADSCFDELSRKAERLSRPVGAADAPQVGEPRLKFTPHSAIWIREDK
jgi:hypothetical protein